MGPNKKIVVLSIIFVVIAAAYLGVLMSPGTIPRWHEPAKPAAIRTRAASTSDTGTQRFFAGRQKVLDLVDANGPPDTAKKTDSINFDTLHPTRLKLRLWGTITGSGIRAQAIIEDIARTKQRMYTVGDGIQNAIVMKIFREKVVLHVDGRSEILNMEAGPSNVNTKDEYGVTALIDASFAGQKEIVELLIMEGADLNAQDNKGDTALMNAAIKGHAEIAELLIANGADVDVRDHAGNTALIDAAKYGRETTCDVMAILIDFGADINAKNKYGITPLMNAAQWGHRANAACLISEGADIDAESNAGASALELSELSEHKDIADLLRRHGAIAD
jgi:hypothetical protein